MSKSRDRRRRWQRREAKGMNHPYLRTMHKLGRAANRTALRIREFGEVFDARQRHEAEDMRELLRAG